jgi:hypothetical protein
LACLLDMVSPRWLRSDEHESVVPVPIRHVADRGEGHRLPMRLSERKRLFVNILIFTRGPFYAAAEKRAASAATMVRP